MIHAQVRLTDKEYQAARREAQRLGISFAELLRRALRLTMASRPWMRHAGMVASGESNASRCVDRVIYTRKA